MYSWLLSCLEQEYEPLRVLKESPRGSVRLIRHRESGRRFILRRFTGNGEVYRKLLDRSCRHLPLIYEAAEQGGENLVIEEFIKGDTLAFLLQGALFSQAETTQIVRQLCQALWVLHSMGAVHRDIKPENVILRGGDAVLIDFDAAIYSMGVLINVMLTGQHPSKKLAKGRMGRIVEHCTRVNPEKRYRDILHLMEVL